MGLSVEGIAVPKGKEDSREEKRIVESVSTGLSVKGVDSQIKLLDSFLSEVCQHSSCQPIKWSCTRPCINRQVFLKCSRGRDSRSAMSGFNCGILISSLEREELHLLQ